MTDRSPDGARAPRAAVIGAGPSGLAATKELRAAGILVTTFEKGNRVGGNWVYSPTESHSSVFETTHIISSKRHSAYRDYPMPPEYPDYPSHRQVLAYFEGYARHFDLGPAIRFGTEVRRVEPGDGGWRLSLGDGSEETFDAVLVATGHHWDPQWPSYPGEFTGQLLHSHQFKTAEPFRNQRVLVVGGGNSGCDIAVETARVSARTGLSWRRGYYIVPKVMFGEPPDVINARLQWLPAAVRERLLQLTWRIVTGGNAAYGLPDPDHDIFESHPVINSELLYFIKHGRIHPYPDIARFEGPEVRFTDGRVEPFDSIVAATGFRITFPFLDRRLVDFGEGDVPLYLKVFHPELRGLYFIGLVQPAGCIWPLAEGQARLVARHLLGGYRLPFDVRSAIDREIGTIRRRYTASPRHTIEVDYHEYLGQLERQLGLRDEKRRPARA